MSEAVRHLSDYETGTRYRATVVSSGRITPRLAPDEVREIVLEVDREDFPYQLGQSIGVLIPGDPAFGHDHPDVADMAVLASPMIGIFRSNPSRVFVKLITRIAIKTGFSHSYAMGSGDYTDEKFKGNELTSDPVRFTDSKKAITKNPYLAVGGATYGWLSATLKSTDILTQPGFAAKITAPILMVIAGNDKIVSIKAQKKFCTMLPNCRLKEISDARHEIFKETDAVRSIFWSEFKRFTHAK